MPKFIQFNDIRINVEAIAFYRLKDADEVLIGLTSNARLLIMGDAARGVFDWLDRALEPISPYSMEDTEAFLDDAEPDKRNNT